MEKGVEHMSKRLKLKVLGFLVAVAIFCMIPLGRAEAASRTTWKTAETVVMDKEYYSDLYSSKPAEWYKIVLSKPGSLYVNFDGPINSARLAIYSSDISSCYYNYLNYFNFFCKLGERAWNCTSSTMISKEIFIKDDICAVAVFEALFWFKGTA